MFKKVSLILCFICFRGIIAYPQSLSQDSITISTYYPSPSGVYKELRLSPLESQPQCDQSKEGTIYYDNNDNQLMMCLEKGATYEWEPLLSLLDGKLTVPGDICGQDESGNEICLSSVQTGEYPGSQLLIHAMHTVDDCLDIGGEPFPSDTGVPICHVKKPLCPKGWTPYPFFTATRPNKCYTTSTACGCPAFVTVGSHEFRKYKQFVHNPCHSDYESGVEVLLYKSYCCTSSNACDECRAILTETGCY